MDNEKHYLFLLGRNFNLSLAELRKFCEIVFFDREKSLAIGKSLKFQNPRNLPKKEAVLFLERLGGTIRFGEILGEFFSEKECKDFCWESIFGNNYVVKRKESLKSEPQNIKEKIKGETQNIKVGFSVFGVGKNFLGDLIGETKREGIQRSKKIRVENFGCQNLNSGQVFETRLIDKGQELILWKKANSFLLARTVANQNLRNYKLRDREKPFRDAKMGMLPPKLAQILINLSEANLDQFILDPFCGSGTLNIEAAIIGYKTVGSDLNPEFLSGAKENFLAMAKKFRYPDTVGDFSVFSADKINFGSQSGVICTEGFLGENFIYKPTRSVIQKNADLVLRLWIGVFENLKKSENSRIEKIVFCLPSWKIGNERISISEKLFAKLDLQNFVVMKPFDGEKTFFYERKETFVSREICVVERKKNE